MPEIFYCEEFGHNIWLVLAAALVCVAGCEAMLGLYRRGLQAPGMARSGWHFLAAIAAGASIWCTHFVGMLAYRPGVPVSFDASLTIASALVAIAGAALAFFVAGREAPREAAALGGALLGLSIAAMHYLGMMAYRVVGLVSWSAPLVALSIVLAVGLGAAALHAKTHGRPRFRRGAAIALLFGAIAGLHFVGMAAIRISPLALTPDDMNGDSYLALALAVVAMTALVLGAAVVGSKLEQDSRVQSYVRLQQMALHDGLTGLANWPNFRTQLSEAREVADRGGGAMALIALDINDFKDVNDRFGHAAGDEFLKQFARRLSALLGGDEFAVVQKRSDAAALDGLLSRLAHVFAERLGAGDQTCDLSAAVGVAIYPADARDLEQLTNNANLALHRAKAERSAQPCFYEPAMDERVRARRQRAGDLRAAILGEGLEVHYQKQARVDDGTTLAFEALVRWPLPDGGYTPPDVFIPLAEECGLIQELGDWVLRAACRDAVAWSPPYKVAVNLSPLQLEQPNLARRVAEILRESGLPPQRLELELTESAVVRDPERSLAAIRAIKALGVTIALDDFGAGHSSLSMLRKFPFDKIKLDRSFLWEIETDKQAKAILRAVLALGRSLHIPVLAEGIETAGQLQMLREETCDLAQGYFLGRPAPMSRLLRDAEIALATVGGPVSAAA